MPRTTTERDTAEVLLASKTDGGLQAAIRWRCGGPPPRAWTRALILASFRSGSSAPDRLQGAVERALLPASAEQAR